jgi:EmrB/QacA subfamily drug resistance transporter
MEITRGGRRLVTGAVMGGIFLSAMDLTAVAPAMPRIVGALGGGELYAWAFSVYAVLSTTTTPVFGRLADRLGRRPVFTAGVGIFLLGSVLSGAAPSMPFFLVARGIQGVGAGALMTTAFTIVGDLYDLQTRARIQGVLSGVWGVASVVGPLVGGTLVETVGWRYVFYINIPVGLAAAHIVFHHLKETGYPREGGALDLLGGTYFSGAVLLLLLGLKLDAPWQLPVLVAAGGAAILFVVRERRTTEPLFDLRLFKLPIYRAANACGFFAGAVLLSLTAYLPVYVMNVRGGTSIHSGLMLTPISAGWVLAATLGGRGLVRFGYRTLVIPGLILLAAATIFVSRIGPETAWPLIVTVLFLVGVSFGLSFTTFLVAVQDEVSGEMRGQATSAVQFFRQIGGALGVATLEVVFLARIANPSLLEAKPGRVFDAIERGQLMAGFSDAFLLAAALAVVAMAAGFLTPGKKRS